MELHVAPQFAVSMTPEIAVVPAVGDISREVRVTVTNAAPGAASGEVTLELPAGWQAQPERVSVQFSREDESRTARFTVSAGSSGGEHRIHARVEQAGRRFDRGFQVVEYAHTARRHVGRPAAGTFKVIDVSVAPDLLVGYIVGVGDAVPQAIEQLGVPTGADRCGRAGMG